MLPWILLWTILRQVNSQASDCPAGTYFDAYLGPYSDCVTCAPGYYCPTEGLTAPLPCPAGYYCPEEGLVAPPPCPAGYYCSQNSVISPSECPIGYYCPQSSTGPTRCPSIWELPDYCSNNCQGLGNTNPYCTGCTAGFYIVEPGTKNAQCSACEPGFYCNGTASLPCSILNCQSPCGTTGCSSVVCTSCDPGFFLDSSGQFCEICPPGYYCDGGSAPTQCDASICTSPCPAQSSSPNCGTDCVDGYFYSARAQDCLICPPGYYCQDNLQIVCTPVANCSSPCGAPGSTTSTTCSSCDPGYYLNTVTSTLQLCVICPVGSYCSNSVQNVCTSGENGCISPCLSSTGLSSFLCGPTCADGYIHDATQAACNKCPAGSYCTNGIQTTCSILNCISSCSSVGNNQPTCSQCASGYYISQNGCVLCPSGSFCTGSEDSPTTCNIQNCDVACVQTGLASPVCQTCQPGYFLDASKSCPICSSGQYCVNNIAISCSIKNCASACGDEGNTSPSCSICADGYQSTNNNGACSFCHDALCLGGQIVPCTVANCNQASCDGATATCHNCQAGYYLDNGQCADCPTGSYCLGGTASYSPCGTANNACEIGFECGGAAGPTCLSCYGGYYQQTAADGACTPCPTGYACAPGMTASQLPNSKCELTCVGRVVCPAGSLSENCGNLTIATIVGISLAILVLIGGGVVGFFLYRRQQQRTSRGKGVPLASLGDRGYAEDTMSISSKNYSMSLSGEKRVFVSFNGNQRAMVLGSSWLQFEHAIRVKFQFPPDTPIRVFLSNHDLQVDCVEDICVNDSLYISANPTQTHQYNHEPSTQQIHVHSHAHSVPNVPSETRQSVVAGTVDANEATYTHGLCSCCGDCTACLLSCCCPCIATGKAAGRAVGTDFNVARCVCFLCCGVCSVHATRKDVQSARGIPGECCENCLLACCCPICVIAQDYRESKLIASGDRELLVA